MNNIRLFSIFIVVSLLFMSCKKEIYDPIPDTMVEFTIDLNKIEFSNLQPIGGSVVITNLTNNFGRRAAGFDYNGILVYHSSFDNVYMAFDRTCPHCYATDSLSVIISVEDNPSMFAKCSNCDTEYNLEINGSPISGPGNFYLKNYHTELQDGRYLTVWNNAK